jgi:hypothetical protein
MIIYRVYREDTCYSGKTVTYGLFFDKEKADELFEKLKETYQKMMKDKFKVYFKGGVIEEEVL